MAKNKPSVRRSLRIAVAGPYSAPTARGRAANLRKMNRAAAELLLMGHVPVIGVNAALAVVKAAGFDDHQDEPNSEEKNDAIMAISMAVIDNCEAILHLASSPGADRERDHLAAKGCPVYESVAEVPSTGKKKRSHR